MQQAPSCAPAPLPPTELLAAWLSAFLGRPVSLTWTRTRRTLFSYKCAGPTFALRLHVVFAEMGEEELEALGTVLKKTDRRAMARLRFFFERRQQAIYPSRPAIALRPQGRVHDLQSMLEEQNHLYFAGRSEAKITWGRQWTPPPGKRLRSLQLGCWVPELKLIRIHPRLDANFVPRFFVTHVVYHEMLHEVFGLGDAQTHRRIHPPEFRAVEQGHPDYARSLAWEAANLARLLGHRP